MLEDLVMSWSWANRGTVNPRKTRPERAGVQMQMGSRSRNGGSPTSGPGRGPPRLRLERRVGRCARQMVHRAGEHGHADPDHYLQQLSLRKVGIQKAVDVLGRYLVALTHHLMREATQGGKASVCGQRTAPHGVQ